MTDKIHIEKSSSGEECLLNIYRISARKDIDRGSSVVEFGKDHYFEGKSHVLENDSDSNQLEHPEGSKFSTSGVMDDSSDQNTACVRHETRSSPCTFCSGEHNRNLCQVEMFRESRQNCVIRGNACFKR